MKDLNKFMKALNRYLDSYRDTYQLTKIKALTDKDDKNKISVFNFVYEDGEGCECVLSYVMAEFIKYLVESNDQLDYDLSKELDYNRLLRKENEKLRDECAHLNEEIYNLKEGFSNGIEIDTSGQNLFS